LYYFFIVQFSTDRKLDLISKEIQENSFSNSIPNKEVIALPVPIPKKEYLTISDEDKIIMEHLFDRHKNILSYNDILDTKVAQIIALNGLILSIILFNANHAKCFALFFLGIIIIIFSMILGLQCYRSRDFFIGASVKFFSDYDTFPDGEGIKKLKKQLLLDIKRNEKTLNFKANLFNKMLYMMFIGLGLVFGGFYFG
jgi:hypothetical protein